MKKILSFCLAAVFLLSACACASKTETAQTSTAQTAGAPESTADGTSGERANAEEQSATPESFTPAPSTLPPTDGQSETGETTDGRPAVELTEADVDLFQNSYDILYNRITDRGYAITSLTGTYFGMFTRDSSIQAMAHVAYGDSDAARAILRYLLSCHAALGLTHGTHIIDEIKDEEYRNNYLKKESAPGGGYYIAQRDCETAIYRINAPDNGAAQPFVPQNALIYGVEAHLNKTTDKDTVNVSILTDYNDPSSAVCETTYTFGKNQSGWQTVVFDEPVAVTPGRTYYLKLQAAKGSGNVVWNGTTRGSNSQNSCNYDVAAFGGWVEKPYDLAFEIVDFPTSAAAQRFTARGNEVCGAELCVYTSAAGMRATVEVRADHTDPSTSLGSVELPLDAAGEKVYNVTFDAPLSVRSGESYDLVVTFTGDGYARLMADPNTPAESFACGDGWVRVGYDFLASAVFDTDRAPLITLDGATAGVQELPTGGELITAVKVLLLRDEQTSGEVVATLLKGDGADAQKIDVKSLPVAGLSTEPGWALFRFDLPLFKTPRDGNYYIRLETKDAAGKVFWCGSTAVDRYVTAVEKDGERIAVAGEAGFEALRGQVRQISDYIQTDTTYMLIHAWMMYVNDNKGSEEDLRFIEESYPLIKKFANFFIDGSQYYNKKLNLIYNPSLEHSRKGRYWQSYDLITNVFASQALRELAEFAEKTGDAASAEKWLTRAKKIEKGIKDNLITEVDGLKIYGEYYDAEDGMKFYQGISWVNFAPVAAEWYAMDEEIMRNTYEIYKKYATVKMYGINGLATDATLGTNEIRRELIGKGTAWELMFCAMIGDTDRVAEIMRLEAVTAEKNRLTVYPESWISQSAVSDPGNQEHCAWQVYAVCRVFPELTNKE